MSHVYVIQAEGGPVKIGVAGDPLARLEALQTASFARLSLEYAGGITPNGARQVEAQVHRRLADHRLSGEWFKVEPAHAVAAIQQVASDLGFGVEAHALRPVASQEDMTPAQCRAARGLLKWNQDDLAERASVSVVTIRNFENEKSSPQRATMEVIRRALEAAGIEFTNGEAEGVRLHRRDKG